MKCPNCEYKDGWNWEGENIEDYKETKGKNGRFFELPIKIEREEPYEPAIKKSVYGCPRCNFIFMGD
jgi:hypothetical protein